MLYLNFYVPGEALEKVKNALFEAGAGKVGNYDQCCWQVEGRGQFRPLPGSDPAIGTQRALTTLTEWKVEMVCEDALIDRAITVLKRAHPYEEVAYGVVRLMDR